MKKFKIFFYPIYLLIAAVAFYYSIDILTHQQEYMERINDFATLRKLPQYLLTVVLIISLLMVIELILENIHLFRMRKKVAEAEEQVLKLKAKLYDESDQPAKSKVLADPVDKVEDEESSQADDYLLDDEDEKD
ncbi:MAG: hypothetical protein ACFHWX_20115 [Bacteroidota bacterium]